MTWPVKPTLLKFDWRPELEAWLKRWYEAGCPIKRTTIYGTVTLDANSIQAAMKKPPKRAE